MKKMWFVTSSTTLMILAAVPYAAEAQLPQGAPPAPRPAAVSARPDTKEQRHHTDAQFAQEALSGGKKEVNSATFAALTASSPEVKALANTLIKDHTTANQQLEQMMADKKEPFVDRKSSTDGESWRTETGASFDRAYLEHVIDEHDDAIELFEEETSKGTDAELKEWAQAKLPTLRAHLKMARDLKSKLGS